MAITLAPMVCPQCGAQIDVPVEKDECFCMYCGTKILINNENVKTININKHIIDEARIEEAKAKNVLNGTQTVIVTALSLIAIIAMMLIMALFKPATT